MNTSSNKKPLYFALLLSLLLHVVFFWMLFAGNLLAYIVRQPERSPETPPLVLELEPLAPMEQVPDVIPAAEEIPEIEKQPDMPEEKYYLIEENPNANEQTPENADILAALASVSATPQDIPTPENALMPPLENPDPTIKQTEQQDEKSAPTDPGINLEKLAGQFVYYQSKEFSRDLLTNDPTQQQPKVDLSKASTKELPPALKDFKGDIIGNVALSTYAWEWAPWVLQLKYAFYRHLYVPRAYSMGLIDGVTEVYLKIGRDGQLVSHRLVGTQGHETLKESTLNAFLASVPWKPLPENFPDQHLELRVRVIYPNLKELFARQQPTQ